MTFTEDLQEPVKRLAFLFDFFLDSGTRHFWNGSRILNVEGTDYVGIGNFGASLAINNSLELGDIEGSFSLVSDQNEIILLALNENFQMRKAFVWLATLDENLLFKNKAIQIEGKITNIDLNTSVESITATIEIESPTKFLKDTIVQNYTRSDQQRVNPLDKIFDFIATSRTNPLPWGKKQT